MLHWLTTAANPRTPATGHDAGQRGWRLHAVEAPDDARFDDVIIQRSVCGLLPAHGWGIDLFIDRRCDRCIVKLGISEPIEIYARQERARWRAERKSKTVQPVQAEEIR